LLELIGDQAHPLCLGLPAVCLGISKLQARFLELSSSPATLRSRDPPAHTPCIGNHSTEADRQQPQASSVSSHQPQLKGTRARTEHHSSSCRTAVSDSCSTLPCPALQIRMNVAACKQRKGKERKGKERKGKGPTCAPFPRLLRKRVARFLLSQPPQLLKEQRVRIVPCTKNALSPSTFQMFVPSLSWQRFGYLYLL
jgi:hypothetical protein